MFRMLYNQEKKFHMLHERNYEKKCGITIIKYADKNL